MKRTRQFELRPCSECGEEYKHYPAKKPQMCNSCLKTQRQVNSRLTEEERKKKYPLSLCERRRRYTRLRNGLQSLDVMDKREKTEYWDNLFKEIQDLGIMEWCTDLRPSTKPKEPGKGKAGRLPNNQRDPKLKYPNTKNWYE